VGTSRNPRWRAGVKGVIARTLRTFGCSHGRTPVFGCVVIRIVLPDVEGAEQPSGCYKQGAECSLFIRKAIAAYASPWNKSLFALLVIFSTAKDCTHLPSSKRDMAFWQRLSILLKCLFSENKSLPSFLNGLIVPISTKRHSRQTVLVHSRLGTLHS
jgi:hypothetical protein